jgi:hypothetical protein
VSCGAQPVHPAFKSHEIDLLISAHSEATDQVKRNKIMNIIEEKALELNCEDFSIEARLYLDIELEHHITGCTYGD